MPELLGADKPPSTFFDGFCRGDLANHSLHPQGPSDLLQIRIDCRFVLVVREAGDHDGGMCRRPVEPVAGRARAVLEAPQGWLDAG